MPQVQHIRKVVDNANRSSLNAAAIPASRNRAALSWRRPATATTCLHSPMREPPRSAPCPRATAHPASLSGHHEIGTGHPAVEVDQIQDQLDTGPDLRVEQSQRCVTGTARGTGSRAFSVSRPVVSETMVDHWRKLRSSASTSWGPAPFCGPNTAAAPFGPSKGLSTSLATMIVVAPSVSRRAPHQGWPVR